jgi:hypothetical protein
MRARSFDEEYQEAWSRDVLAHGLPELPSDLMEGEAVPVSWWVGPSTAAVLHIRRRRWDDDEEPDNETDVDCFRLVGERWDMAVAAGRRSRR